MNLRIKPKFVLVQKGKNIVILTEEEYEQILDVLDAMEAQRVLADDKGPVLKWEDVHGQLVGNKIAQARKALGITQKELAQRMKVKQSAVSKIERDDTRPPIDTLKEVALALNCNIDDLA